MSGPLWRSGGEFRARDPVGLPVCSLDASAALSQPDPPYQLPNATMAAQAPVAAEYVVIGIPVANPTTANLVRNVVRVASAMTIFLISQNVVLALLSDESTDLFNVVVSTFIALLIPACGYYGAKQRDRSLVCCFCGCSCFNAVFVCWMLISYISYSANGDNPDSAGVQAITIILLIASSILYALSYYLGAKLYNDREMFIRMRGRPPSHVTNVPVASIAYPAQPEGPSVGVAIPTATAAQAYPSQYPPQYASQYPHASAQSGFPVAQAQGVPVAMPVN